VGNRQIEEGGYKESRKRDFERKRERERERVEELLRINRLE
jgi:hypothetical protein